MVFAHLIPCTDYKSPCVRLHYIQSMPTVYTSFWGTIYQLSGDRNSLRLSLSRWPEAWGYVWFPEIGLPISVIIHLSRIFQQKNPPAMRYSLYLWKPTFFTMIYDITHVGKSMPSTIESIPLGYPPGKESPQGGAPPVMWTLLHNPNN